MLYKNISDKPKIALVHMVKRRIQPGETVSMGSSDIKHLGSNMRFFEPAAAVEKAEAVKKEEPVEEVQVDNSPATTEPMEELSPAQEEGEAEQSDTEPEPEPETPTENEPEPGPEPEDAEVDEETTPAEKPAEDTEQISDDQEVEGEPEQQ